MTQPEMLMNSLNLHRGGGRSQMLEGHHCPPKKVGAGPPNSTTLVQETLVESIKLFLCMFFVHVLCSTLIYFINSTKENKLH